MVKTYNVSVITNQKCSETTLSTVNNLHV